jgi:predicted hydrocarbon binding protein
MAEIVFSKQIMQRVVHDIEERTCRAMGAQQCEFKVTIGG